MLAGEFFLKNLLKEKKAEEAMADGKAPSSL